METLLLALLIVAAVAHLLLAGAGTIRLAVQLPARRRLGPVAFATFSRAADMGRGGLTWYPLLGVLGPVATLAALGVGYAGPASSAVRVALVAAAIGCVLHSVTTARAAPAMWRAGRAGNQPEAIAPHLETFARWSWPRTVLQAMTAAALMIALLLNQGPGQLPHAVLVLALIAFALATVLTGAALDQVIVHIPAGRKIGTGAYAGYLRAADLKNGRAVYPAVGLSSNVMLIATLVAASASAAPLRYTVAFAVAAGCGLTAFLVTARTIPAAAALTAGPSPGDDAAAALTAGPNPVDEAAIARLTAGARARAPLFSLIFGCLLWALIQR